MARILVIAGDQGTRLLARSILQAAGREVNLDGRDSLLTGPTQALVGWFIGEDTTQHPVRSSF
jgi:hypothetical protein